jgi:ERCC4-type nuclease
MPTTLQAIVVDQREPSWVQSLTFGGVPVDVSLLDTGDVWAMCSDSATIVIERKTGSDLLNTLRQGRLLPECARMLNVSRFAYLVVTGSLMPDANGMTCIDHGQTGWSWAAVQGAFLQLQELGIGVVQFGQDSDFEQAVRWLAGRRHDPTMLVPPVKTAQFLSVGESILASLPGIGLERAQAIMTYCGTPAQALAFLTDLSKDAETLPGIGKGIKNRVRLALCVPEGAELVVVQRQQERGS